MEILAIAPTYAIDTGALHYTGTRGRELRCSVLAGGEGGEVDPDGRNVIVIGKHMNGQGKAHVGHVDLVEAQIQDGLPQGKRKGEGGKKEEEGSKRQR